MRSVTDTSEDVNDASLLSLKRNVRWCAPWDNRGAELLNAALTLTFGVWLLMPWNCFQQCPSAYYVMEVVGGLIWPRDPEVPWGILFMGVSILKSIVLWRDHLRGRKWSSLLSGALWTTVAVTVGFTNYQTLMFPLYGLFALNMYRNFLCIQIPNRHAHESAMRRKG